MMMSFRRSIPFALLVLTAQSVRAAQEKDLRPASQIADSIEIAQTARTITHDATNDSARAAMLYDWVAHGVRYDVKSFLSGARTDDRAEAVYRGRLAVCAGFVALYSRMANEVGIETHAIHGYAKGFNYVNGQSTGKPNHSWLAVRLGKDWKLVDPTWGAGVVVNGKFEPHFIWDYFLVSPRALQLSHFPEDDEWQLVNRPISRREFEHMSAVPRTMVAIGFDPDSLRRTAQTNARAGFPLVSELSEKVRVLKAPLIGTLSRQAPVAVDIIWPGAADVAIVSGGAWTPLSRAGERFQGQALAAGADVMLVGRKQGAEYETLLYYHVQ